MRIIQSFWSLPSKAYNRNDNFGRNNGGWIAEKYHAMSWSLSCLKFNQFYNDVELYTDTDGYDWLINKLGLPYTNVFKSLDDISNYDISLWALPKLNTFMRQTEPFLHADGDVYIWKPFSNNFLAKELFVQNIECDILNNPEGNIYIETLKKLEINSAHVPDFLKKTIRLFKQTGKIEAFNMGIVGGKNVEFFKEYAKQVFLFLDKNKEIAFQGIDMNFIEQFLLYCLADEYKLPADVLFGEENVASNGGYATLQQFNLVPISKSYIHLLGGSKTTQNACLQLALRLQYEFPVMYNHILSIYKEEPTRHYLNSRKLIDKPGLRSVFQNTLLLLNRLGFKFEKKAFKGFFDFVEDVLCKSEDSIDLRRLNDVFQFEKFAYFSAYKNPKSKFNEIEHRNKLFKLLYNSTICEFLKNKFTLNTVLINIIAVNFKYPPEFSINTLNTIIMEQQPDSISNDMLLLKFSEDNMIHAEVIDNGEALLTYFDENHLSGYELIDFIKNEKLQIKSEDNDLEAFALSFLTTCSLYHNYLVLV